MLVTDDITHWRKERVMPGYTLTIVDHSRSMFLWTLVFMLVATVSGSKRAQAGVVDMYAAHAVASEVQDAYYLDIMNMAVGDTPIWARWSLDFSNANWNLEEVYTQVSPDLQFTPDPGIRVDHASNPGVALDRSTGTIYLYYEERVSEGPGNQMVVTSSDGLVFSNPVEADSYHARLNPRVVLLPDGTWRRYSYSPQEHGFVSESSGDGLNFTADEGVRYYLQPEDNDSAGVYTVYVDHTGGVVLLYIGDMAGEHSSIRRAYSTDLGDSFTFEEGDLTHDRDLAVNDKFVDPKVILLPDGRWRLITMRRGPNGPAPVPGQKAVGEIHTFISTNGKDFYHEPGIRIKTDDFAEFSVWSLNDPVMVRLPDGRYRIYVAALVDDDTPGADPPTKYVIVSATSN